MATYSSTSRAGQAGGGSFQKKTPISQRKNLPIECAQGDRPARCPFHAHDPRVWVDHGNSSKSQDSTRSYQTSFTKHETAACNRPSTATSLTCKPDPNDTTRYYKVLLQSIASTTQFYKVLQTSTPVLLRPTKYYSVLPSTTQNCNVEPSEQNMTCSHSTEQRYFK